MVGVPGLEPGASSLSGTRSNQLSYTPICGLPGRSSKHRGLRPGFDALASLAQLPDIDIEPGSDVTANGRVVGNYMAEITCNDTTLLVIDAASETKTLVDNTLRNAGKLTVIVDPAAPDAAATIQSLLGGP